MEDIEQNSDAQNGPPASNLRRNSGRSMTAERSMAAMGDKTEKPNVKRKNRVKEINTPSVKTFLNKGQFKEVSEQEQEQQGETDNEWQTTKSDIEQWSDGLPYNKLNMRCNQVQSDAEIADDEAGSQTSTVPEYEEVDQDQVDGEEGQQEEEDEIDFNNLTLQDLRAMMCEMHGLMMGMKKMMLNVQEMAQDKDKVADKLLTRMKGTESRMWLLTKAIVKQDKIP